MGLNPAYRLIANSEDITAIIRERFKQLRYSDDAGLESDMLEIDLSDHDPDNPIQTPPTGAELELFLGYDGAAQRMGLFVVDEIEFRGWPGELRIIAHAAPFDVSTGGKENLQTQKTRSWDKGTTIGAMVAKIAKEHGMEPAVSPSLKSVALPHLDQSDESDMHFLVRLARKYDAIVKPAGGKIVVVKHGETKTTSGEDLPAVTLEPGDVTRFSVIRSTRENSGMVVASWHENRKAKRHLVKVGKGEPVARLRRQYSTREMALAAATAELDKRQRGKASLSLSMPGRTDLQAEAPLTLEGFRDGVAGDWVIRRVEHVMTADGYACTLDAELPNSGDTADVEEVTE